jgi:hypothetical protein
MHAAAQRRAWKMPSHGGGAVADEASRPAQRTSTRGAGIRVAIDWKEAKAGVVSCCPVSTAVLCSGPLVMCESS